jgi:hypothetical protein
VKTWATGRNYLGDGKTYPRPTTLAEFKQQCIDAQVGVTIPDYITSIVVAQASKEVMFIKLPPKEMIEDSEKTLATEPYTLPPFYKNVFGTDPNIGTALDAKLTFHAFRIGDYTISICT